MYFDLQNTYLFVFLFRQPLVKMEALMLRFPHLPEQIFQKLDNETLFKSREVARSWQDLIDEGNYPWLRIVNIPTILKNENTYLHLSAETGQIEAFKTAFRKEEDKNIKNHYFDTPFYLACIKGRSMIVQFLLKNTDLEFMIKEKEIHGKTAFVLACQNGHLDMVKILMDNAANLGIDLNETDVYGRTAFISACINGHSAVVKIFMENAASLKIDLKMGKNKYNNYLTAFHIKISKIEAVLYSHETMHNVYGWKNLSIHMKTFECGLCTSLFGFHFPLRLKQIRIFKK